MRNHFSETLSALRRARGLTQAELAEQMHYTYQAVSNWERGVSMPDADTLLNLAAFFGVTTDELLGEKKKLPPPARPARENFRISPARARSDTAGSLERVQDTASADSGVGWVRQGKVGAAKALFAALAAESIALILILFSALFGNAIMFFAAVIPAFIVLVVAYVAVTVLFFFAKVPDSIAAFVLLAVGVAVQGGAVVALCILLGVGSDSASAELLLKVALYAGMALQLAAAPFAFRRTEPVALYFFLAAVQLCGAVLSEVLSSGGWAIFFDLLSGTAACFLPWRLYFISENREYGRDYAAERRAERAARRQGRQR